MAHDTDTARNTGAYIPVNDSSASTAKAPRQRKFAAKQVFATILIVLAVVLCLENTQHVNIRLIGPQVNSPLWVLVAASLVLGLVAGLLLGHKSKKSRKK